MDIVVIAPDKTLVFVEVKTMRPGILKPEDQMSGAKMSNSAGRRKYTRVPNEELISDKRGWRLDLVALVKKIMGLPKPMLSKSATTKTFKENV